MSNAGFWRRLGAYTIDIVPIVLVIAAVFYVFLGFDRVLQTYTTEPGNLEARIKFLTERNKIRDSAFLVWLIYSTLMEASALQGTLGKRVLRIRVVGPDGGRLALGRSLARNLAKLLSYLPCALGFLWVAFSKKKHAWHDMIAKTSVVLGSPERRGAIAGNALLPHPPLATGQYVSYFHDHGDGTWWSCHMTVLSRAAGGDWMVLAQGREQSFDVLVLLKLPASPAKEDQPVAPLKLDVVRGAPPPGHPGPMTHAARFMNLLSPARTPGAREALSADPVPGLFPCEIREVFPLIDPWPEFSYEKQHDLCPRIPLSGIAATWIVGTNNRVDVTSFGCSNPEAPLPGYDDHIDFSHMVRISQRGFSSLWPSTWFLQDSTDKREAHGAGARHLHLQLGGPTAASHVVIDLHPSGSRPDHDRWHKRARGEDLPSCTFKGRVEHAMEPGGEVYECAYREGQVVGHTRDAWLPATDGRTALISFFCCALDDNPRRDSTLRGALEVWKTILESWSWESAEQAT
jgi:uncharacterized RDD family membrane protein YckC